MCRGTLCGPYPEPGACCRQWYAGGGVEPERPKLQGWCDGRGGPPAAPPPRPGHSSRSLLVGPVAEGQVEEAGPAWLSFTPWASGMATCGHSVLETIASGAPGCAVLLDVRCGCSRAHEKHPWGCKWLPEAAPAPRPGWLWWAVAEEFGWNQKAWASFLALPNQTSLGSSLDCSELISHVSKGD